MTIEEQLFLNTESFDSSGSRPLFLSEKCICTVLIVDLPGSAWRSIEAFHQRSLTLCSFWASMRQLSMYRSLNLPWAWA